MVTMTPWVKEQIVRGMPYRVPVGLVSGQGNRIEGNMNEELSDAIMESVQDIFHGFLALELCPGEENGPVGQTDHKMVEALVALHETSMVVGFTGALRGGVRIETSTLTALNLAGALAGKSFESLSGNVLDILGELVDLVAGGLCTRLSSYGQIHLTPPIVVVGSQYTLNNSRIFSRVRQFFQVNGDNFFVECYYLKDLS